MSPDEVTRAHLERIVIEAAVWQAEEDEYGIHPAPDELLDSIDDGTFDLALFTDETCRLVARLLLLEVVEQERPPTPLALLVWLIVFARLAPIDAMAAISSPGAFGAAGHRITGALGYWLGQLHDLDEREHLARVLHDAQHALGQRGASERVRAQIREAVAA